LCLSGVRSCYGGGWLWVVCVVVFGVDGECWCDMVWLFVVCVCVDGFDLYVVLSDIECYVVCVVVYGMVVEFLGVVFFYVVVLSCNGCLVDVLVL